MGADLGLKEFDGNQMQFFQDGKVNMPRRRHGAFFLAQYVRFGLARSTPDYANLPSKLILSDLYAEVASVEKVTVPNDDMSPFTLKLDGATFDPRKPQDEAARP